MFLNCCTNTNVCLGGCGREGCRNTRVKFERYLGKSFPNRLPLQADSSRLTGAWLTAGVWREAYSTAVQRLLVMDGGSCYLLFQKAHRVARAGAERGGHHVPGKLFALLLSVLLKRSKRYREWCVGEKNKSWTAVITGMLCPQNFVHTFYLVEN